MMKTLIILLFALALLASGVSTATEDISPCGHDHGERPVKRLSTVLAFETIGSEERKTAMQCLARYREGGFDVLLAELHEALEENDRARLLEDIEVIGRIADRKIVLGIVDVLRADVHRDIKLTVLAPLPRLVVATGASYNRGLIIDPSSNEKQIATFLIFGQRSTDDYILKGGNLLTAPKDLNIIKGVVEKLVKGEEPDSEMVKRVKAVLESIETAQKKLEEIIKQADEKQE